MSPDSTPKPVPLFALGCFLILHHTSVPLSKSPTQNNQNTPPSNNASAWEDPPSLDPSSPSPDSPKSPRVSPTRKQMAMDPMYLLESKVRAEEELRRST